MTRRQQQLLLAYQAFRASPPAVGKLAWRMLPVYLLLFVLCGAVAGLAIVAEMPWYATAVLGFFAGVLLRDLGSFLATVQCWPIIVHIVDWQKVDELMPVRGNDI